MTHIGMHRGLVATAVCVAALLFGQTAPMHPATAQEANGQSTSLRVVPVRDVHLTRLFVGGVAMTGDIMTLALGSQAGHQATRLARFDARSGKFKTFARTIYESGAITSVAATGDWVAWTDQSRIQQEVVDEVRWTLFVENLKTHERRRLASSGAHADSWIPVTVAASGQVAWSQWLGTLERGNDVYVHSLRAGTTTRRLHGLHVGQIVPTPGGLLYHQVTFVDKAHYNSSVMYRSWSKRQPIRLSRSLSTELIAYSNGWAAWQEPDYNSPQRIVASRIGSGRQIVIAGPLHENVQLGTSFAVDYDIATGGWEVRPLTQNDKATALSVPSRSCFQCGLFVSGDVVAWGEYVPSSSNNPDVRIRVARVVVSK